jgi:hypothetical protein
MSAIDQKEYLKKYLGLCSADEEKKKKKKKKKKQKHAVVAARLEHSLIRRFRSSVSLQLA